MKFFACGFLMFVVSYLFMAGCWTGGQATWITVVGIAFSARFIAASVLATIFGYWVG